MPAALHFFRPGYLRVYAMRLAVRMGVALLAVALLGSASPALARPGHGTAMPEVALQELPREARGTYAAIRAGGPFTYNRDGVVFGNRERLLPERARGYYHEYTVPTPGGSTRGARRIVCGGQVTTPEACFYTDDHYRSFRRIRP
ncbi:MAG: ribonuclease domain-containing protein [Casimicrobiaceae bacterium]